MSSRFSTTTGIRSGLATRTFLNTRVLAFTFAIVGMASFLFHSPASAQNSGKSSDEPASSKQDDEPKSPKDRQERGKRKRPGRPEGEEKGMPGESNKDFMPRPQGGEGRPLERFRRMFAELDKDQSGTIDKSEAPERLLERWDMIDSDSDGQINHEEVRALITKMGERMRNGPPPGKPGEEMTPGAGEKKRRSRDRMDRWGDKEPSGGSVEPVRPGGGKEKSDDDRDGEDGQGG